MPVKTFSSTQEAIQFVVTRTETLLQHDVAVIELSKITLRALIDSGLVIAEDASNALEDRALCFDATDMKETAGILRAVAKSLCTPPEPDRASFLRVVPSPDQTGD